MEAPAPRRHARRSAGRLIFTQCHHRARRARAHASIKRSSSYAYGRSTATDEPSGGSSASQRRCFAPPSVTMACHPSCAQRSSLSTSMLEYRSYRLDAAERTAARTDSTVDSTSGAQKIACWSDVFCGSAAKRQPPSLSKVVRHRAGSFAGGQGHIVSLVLAIAAQPFPGYVRSFCFLGVRIGFL